MSHEKTWDLWTKSWSPMDAESRRALYAQCVDEQAVYTDPLAQVQGWQALQGYMDGFHAQLPGARVETTSYLSHNDRSVATWKAIGPDGSVWGEGISYGEYSETGKLRVMTGFFEASQ